jgi:hypothetical protein
VTVYPVVEEKLIPPTTPQQKTGITVEEERLLRRIREARRKGEIIEFVINVREMTLRSIGTVERLAKT